MTQPNLENPYTGVPGVVADALLSIEAVHHDLGWGNGRAMLYAVIPGRDPETCDVVGLPVGRLQPAAVELDTLTDDMECGRLPVFPGRPAVGYFAVIESLNPDGIEVRFGCGVVGEHTFTLLRTRGSEPGFVTDDPFRGVVRTLRRIQAAATREWAGSTGATWGVTSEALYATMVKSVEHPYTGLTGEMLDLLGALEAEHHAAGWDNTPATLYFVTCRERPGRYRLPCLRLGVAGDPQGELEFLADCLERDTPTVLPTRRIVALFVVLEGWGLDTGTVGPDETRRLADIPGSVEVRFAFGVVGEHAISVSRYREVEFVADADGELVRRVRDTEPVATADVGDASGIAGRMVDSLRRLQAAIARHTPSVPE